MRRSGSSRRPTRPENGPPDRLEPARRTRHEAPRADPVRSGSVTGAICAFSAWRTPRRFWECAAMTWDDWFLVILLVSLLPLVRLLMELLIVAVEWVFGATAVLLEVLVELLLAPLVLGWKGMAWLWRRIRTRPSVRTLPLTVGGRPPGCPVSEGPGGLSRLGSVALEAENRPWVAWPSSGGRPGALLFSLSLGTVPPEPPPPGRPVAGTATAPENRPPEVSLSRSPAPGERGSEAGDRSPGPVGETAARLPGGPALHCVVCGRPLRRPKRGPLPRFCSGGCRVRAFRERRH